MSLLTSVNLDQELYSKMPSWLRTLVARILPFKLAATLARLIDRGSRILLDIGCGRGDTMKMVLRLCGATKKNVLGIDCHRRSLTIASAIYDDVILADARYLPFKKGSFDTVLALELIEHLEKSCGQTLLDNVETLARRQIILSTTNGLLPQKDIENVFQTHRSAWVPSEFTARHYKVRGVGGPRMIKNRGSPTCIFSYIVSQVIIYYFPTTISSRFVCLKSIQSNAPRTVYAHHRG